MRVTALKFDKNELYCHISLMRLVEKPVTVLVKPACTDCTSAHMLRPYVQIAHALITRWLYVHSRTKTDRSD